jgi:glutathione S-transferase
MHLYDMLKAPNPRRVRMFLAEKGISLPTTEIDISTGANLCADYLAINPRGVVPTLQLDDGSIIDESVAICRYLEGLYPEPNLFGIGPREQAEVERWGRRAEFDGMFNIAAIFRNRAPHLANRAAPGTAPALAQDEGLAQRGEALLPGFFSMLNDRLQDHEFLAGERLTIADITAFICVDFAKWVRQRIPEAHAHSQRWYAAIKARPSAQA